jgi:hypothetical protein
MQQITWTLIEQARADQPRQLNAFWLASLADEPLRELTRPIWETLAKAFAELVECQNTITFSGGVALAPARVSGTVVNVPPLPADTITTGTAGTRNPNWARAGLIMLAVITWLMIFVLPILIQNSGMSQDTKITADTEVGLIAALAAPITIELLKDKRE